FAEPQLDAGYKYVVKLIDLTKPPAAADGAPAAPADQPAPAPDPVQALLQEAERELNPDRRLAESFAKAGNVVPMMLFHPGQPQGKPDKPLPDYVASNNLPNVA